MKMTNLFTIALCFCLFAAKAPFAQAGITIAAQGKSTFTIVVPVNAPASIKEAAAELQNDIKLSTGAKITIREDNADTTGSLISLGATAQAAAADISAADVGIEGFRIQTKNSNLYIIGPDTPDGQYAQNGGTSNGTANGVYTFLEDYLGVRWLMPGKLGLDLPKKSTFEIPEIDRTYTPPFIYRNLTYVQKKPSVDQWKTRQKLGYSFHINDGHNWYPTVPASLYKTHPDWFAMINGKRLDPASLGNRYKLETTNPEVVKYFAEKAVAALKADPHLNTFSLSPNDSRGWSESPQSKALYDPPPPGSTFPSITPLILKWYRDVSSIVEKEYPQGKLAGFIYTDFSYPPQKGSMKLPENFIPVITGKGFGYRFFRPVVRKEAKELIQAWAKVAPSTWFYYGMPIWLRNSTGMVTTAAPDNLNFVFSLLRENHIKGAELYGSFSWSQAAMGNYIEAKMLWDPTLDAFKVRHDWLVHAYGAQAGEAMEKLYDSMNNGAFADYFRQPSDPHYNVDENLFKDYYGPNYPQIEKYFLNAESQPITKIQKQRLQLIENNLIVLQWRLRNAGYLPADYNSPLHRSDAEVAGIISQRQPRSQTEDFPNLTIRPQKQPVKKIVIEDSPAARGNTKDIPNANRILLYPTKDMTIHLQALNVHPGSSFLMYVISRNMTAQDSLYGYQEQKGVLYSGEEISFEAKANTGYYFYAEPTGVDHAVATWDLQVDNAMLSTANYQNEVLTLHGKPSALYVYLPEQMNMKPVQNADSVSLLSNAASSILNRQYPNAHTVLKLDTDWRFITDPKDIGLQQKYNEAAFNDSSWKSIDATSYWQDQGYSDYHGIAWYRKTFEKPTLAAGDPQGVNANKYLLYFGAVDGDAVIYVNGKKIGEHLPSKMGNGWDQPFIVDATKAMKPGQNVVAVKVRKDKYKSGIYRGVILMMAEK